MTLLKTGRSFVCIALVLWLTYQNARTSFVSSPLTVTPTKTQALTLSCKPNSEGLGTVLAVHIKKKDEEADSSAEEPDHSDTESSQQAEVTESDSEEPGDESEDNEKSRIHKYNNYPYNSLRPTDPNMFRHKRSAQNSFVTATLMSSSKIVLVPQIDRFLAEGDISNPVHLTVTIKYPDAGDLGLYECQVTHIDETGNIEVKAEMLKVEEAIELSLETLEQRVNQLEGQIPALKTIGEWMQNTVKEITERHKMMVDEVAALKKENMELVKSVADMANDIRSLNTKVSMMSGQEQGGTPTDGSNQRNNNNIGYQNNGYNNNYNNGGYPQNNYGNQNGYQGNNQRYNDGYQNSQYGDNGFQPHPQNEPRSDELFQVNARMDELENTRIHVLEQQVAELSERESTVEDRTNEIEFIMNSTLEDRLAKLENFNWKGIVAGFQRLELETVPILFKNITTAQRNITSLQRGISLLADRKQSNDDEITKMLKDFPTSTPNNDKVEEEEAEASTESVSVTEEQKEKEKEEEKEEQQKEEKEKGEEHEEETTTTTVAIKPIKGHACYVCGNNKTQEHCTGTSVKNVEACPEDKTNCITDVYQDGHFRRIYKRCASDEECENDVPKSAKACEKDSFITPTAMQCHFCCTSAVCNDYIRPSRTMYHLKSKEDKT